MIKMNIQVKFLINGVFVFLGSSVFFEKNEVIIATSRASSIQTLSSLGYDEITEIEDTIDSENATFFVVVADTGFDYNLLSNEMFKLNQRLGIPIDTMGRSYNVTKNLIALPDDADDEIYAGDYFPRRFPSENLSLEYLSVYKRNTTEKTIALVIGIYETEELANKMLAKVRRYEDKAFMLESEIYVGCLH